MEILRRFSRIPVLTYHSICNTKGAYSVDIESFRHQMEYIKKNYQIIRATKIKEVLENDCSLASRVAITFDDGYDDFYDNAFPILNDLKIPCSVFIPVGCIGSYNKWDSHNHLLPKKSVMGASRLKELSISGLVDFGSHGVNHTRMTCLDINELRWEANESKKILEDILCRPISMFAYPYGMREDYSCLTDNIILDAGYKIVFTSHWGVIQDRKNKLSLKRIELKNNDSAFSIYSKISGFYGWVGFKQNIAYIVKRWYI